MTTLIHTPCSRRHLLMDRAVTAMGWSGFAWLFVPSSVAQASTEALNINHNAVTLFSLTLFVCSLCLMAWSSYNKWLYVRGRIPDRPTLQAPLTDSTLAEHFAINRHDLESVHESRRTIIYHTDEGAIVRLETDDPTARRLRLIA